MKKSSFLLLCLMTLPAMLDAQPKRILHALFPDGTGVDIITRTTGSSRVTGQGSLGIDSSHGTNVVTRFVMDNDKVALFAYSLFVSRGAEPNTVMIRIEPLDPSDAEEWMNEFPGRTRPSPSGRVPTVSGVRNFPSVRIGEAVMLDVLYNPATGEKAYDVLRPFIIAPEGQLSVSSVPAQETISLRQIAMRIDGRNVAAPSSWIVGRAVRVEIPGGGAYVIAAYEPPADGVHVFAPAAQASGKTLNWKMGAHRVEITSDTDILFQSQSATLWVYRDPGNKRHGRGAQLRFQAADTVDSLLPDRKDKK